MSDLSIAPVVCVRCGTSMTGQYHYLGALGPLCGRCFGEEMAANRAAYQAVPAYGAEPDCEPRIRELEAKVERLEAERESFYMDYRMKCDAETKALHVKVERLEASVERTARAFRACEQAREDAAALHRAEVERLRAVQRAFLRDNRDKTNAVRELQAALAGVLRSFEAYALLCDPPEELDEYDEMMLPAWQKAASLVPGFDPKAPEAWVQDAALEEG